MLSRTSPLGGSYSASAWVTPGSRTTISIPEAGLKVSFPQNAVSQPVYVTIVANAGKLVTYDFYPHGTTFSAPVTVEQDLRSTNALNNTAFLSSIGGGYMPDGIDDVDPVRGKATISEAFPVRLSNAFQTAKFSTTHFSGYTLVSGLTIRVSIEIDVE